MRIAITGASGNLGRLVMDTAVNRGHSVVALARTVPGGARSVQWRHFDLAHTQTDWAAALESCEAVIHLAAAKSPAESLWQANVLAAGRLVAEMARAGVPRLVLASAANLFAGATDTIAPHMTAGPVDRIMYLASKGTQEWTARAACEEHGIGCAAMRISSIVGTGQSVLDRFAQHLLRHEPLNIGSFGADFVHAKDVASALMMAAERQLEGTYHVTSGERVSLADAARAIAAVTGAGPGLLRFEAEGTDEGFGAVPNDTLRREGWQPASFAELASWIVARERAALSPEQEIAA